MNNSQKISFRLANNEDIKELLNWRNDPITRKLSFSSKKISFKEHKTWFDKILQNPNKQLLIILNENLNKIGQVRFDKIYYHAEISIGLAPNMRSKGYGTKSIIEAINYYFNNYNAKYVIAKIKKENEISIKVFEKAGFSLFKKINNYIEMRIYK